IDRVEQTGDAGALRDAVRGLHQGLSRLAEQIARTASESSEHIAALTANLDTMAGKLGSTRDDLMRLEQSVEERLTALAGRLSTVEENTQPAGRVEETVTQLHSRLDSAEERLQQGLSEHLAAIERNLHGITAKLEAAERSGDEAQTLIRENLRHLSQRLEATEKRSKDNWTEWKSGFTEAAKRIERLESESGTKVARPPL